MIQPSITHGRLCCFSGSDSGGVSMEAQKQWCSADATSSQLENESNEVPVSCWLCWFLLHVIYFHLPLHSKEMVKYSLKNQVALQKTRTWKPRKFGDVPCHDEVEHSMEVPVALLWVQRNPQSVSLVGWVWDEFQVLHRKSCITVMKDGMALIILLTICWCVKLYPGLGVNARHATS